jgi:hypothetical protein
MYYYINRAQQYAKAFVAGAGSIVTALTALSTDLGMNIIPGEALPYVTFALAALTSFATWAVPNVEFEVYDTEG